jgi:hypothetical protein
MHGHFNISLRDARGYEDPKHWSCLSPQEQLALHNSFGEVQRVSCDNQVFDNWAACMFLWMMGGGSISNPYNKDDGGGKKIIWGFICLLNTSSEPSYTEASNQVIRPTQVSGSVDTADSVNAAAKRFVLDDIDDHTIRSLDSLDGREGVQYSARWLYLPYQSNSSVIRSIGVYYNEAQSGDEVTTESNDIGIIARTRLKDGAGNPIVINKTSSQSLLVEWEFTLLNV